KVVEQVPLVSADQGIELILPPVVDAVRHVDPGRFEVAVHPRFLQREECRLRPVEEHLLVEVRILGLQRSQVIAQCGTHLSHGGVGRAPVRCLDRMANAHPAVRLIERKRDEEKEDEPAATSAEEEEGQQQTAAAEPTATATIASTTAKPATTAKALTAAGASQREQRARQQERQRHKGTQGQAAAPAHDFSGAPPPVSDWPQLVQNLPLA